MEKEQLAKKALIEVLQLAYSGELAAANAYRGHWISVRDRAEKDAIFQIEIEELLHRQEVGKKLAALGAKPRLKREIMMNLIGRTIGFLCLFGGWFIPMYGAGKLEFQNINEYEAAAQYAYIAGLHDWVDELLEMAELEWEHEHFFYQKVVTHPLSRWVKPWREPEPKTAIRQRFETFKKELFPEHDPDASVFLS